MNVIQSIDPAFVLVCCCVLLCTHLRDPVPHFRRHPFSDYGFASVFVCVCVCVEKYYGKCCVPTSTRMSLPRLVISASHLSNYDTSSWKTYSHPSNPRGPPDLHRKCRMRSSLPSKPKSRAAGCPRAEVSRSKKVGFSDGEHAYKLCIFQGNLSAF